MKTRFPIAIFALLALTAPLSADVVTDWNGTLLQAIRTGSTNPPIASRNMAMVHTAIYDAVNSIDDTHRPYLVNLDVPGTTSREAAAAKAARDVLAHLYPTQAATFDTALSNHLSAIADSQAKTDGLNLGASVAASIIAHRTGDGSAVAGTYSPSGVLGKWSPTPPANAAALLPGWGNVTPWAMTSGSQFRVMDAPPALGSAEYATAYNEVKSLGAATGSTRTADQSAIAQFWADGGGTSTPQGHWNRIATSVSDAQGLSLSENARMFALLNIAGADAAIACWDNKFTHDYWRPISAIRSGEADGNAATTGDAAWSSFIPTPPFPSYTSGHSTFSGAAATVLAQFFGTDNVSFTTSAEGFATPDRSFTSFSQAADEAMNSRLYGGIHWRFDNEDGLATGAALGSFVMGSQLAQIPEPSTLMLAAIGGAGCAVRWAKRRRR